MRPTILVASASVALAHLASATSPNLVSGPPATVFSSLPPPPAAAAAANQSIGQLADPPSCCTATRLSTVSHLAAARPNATASHAAEVTGGAIPQQMQASVVGLLGFCIMGLVML